MKKNIETKNTLVICDICQQEVANIGEGKSSWYFHGNVHGVIEKLNVEYKVQTQRGTVDNEKIVKSGYSAFPAQDICSVKCFKEAFKEWLKIVEDLLKEPTKVSETLAKQIVNEIENSKPKED